MDTDALLLTLRLALSTTLILVLIALPLAWWIASGSERGPGVGRAVLQSIVALPLVLPPTVIGFYLLVALGPLTLPGKLFIRIFGHPLAFSFSGLLAGSIVYSMPFAVQPLIAGFRAVDRSYLEASAGLGASPAKTFWRVVLPNPASRSALLTAAVLTFTHTVGEFGVVLMLGGNIPGATRTLSIALYDQVQEFDYSAANRTALLLLGFSMVALLLIYLLPSLRQLRQNAWKRGELVD